MGKNRVSFIFLLCLVSFLFFSCKTDNKKDKWDDTMTTGVVAISCDEGYRPIIEEEVEVFESIYNQATVVPIFTNEVEAIDLLLKDSVRLPVTSRKLTQKEQDYIASKKMFVREIPVAWDAITLIVNKANPDSIIGMPTLKKILTGQITDWKQLDPKSKLGKIDVLFDNPNSSIVRYAIDSICRGEKLSAELYAQKTNSDVVGVVAKNPNSLGIIGLNWVGNETDTTNLSFNEQIRVMRVSIYEEANLSNSYLPFQYYLDQRDYPMIREVYFLLSDPRSGLSSGFTSFVTSFRGQKIIYKSGILPITQPIRTVEIKQN